MSEIHSLNIHFDRIHQIIKSCEGAFNFKSAAEIADVLNEADKTVNNMFKGFDNISSVAKDLTTGDPGSVLELKLKNNPYLGFINHNCMFLNTFITKWSTEFHIKYSTGVGYKVYRRKEFSKAEHTERGERGERGDRSVKLNDFIKKPNTKQSKPKKPSANYESANASKKAVPKRKTKFIKDKRDDRKSKKTENAADSSSDLEEVEEPASQAPAIQEPAVQKPAIDAPAEQEPADLAVSVEISKVAPTSDLGEIDFTRADDKHSWADD